MLIIKPTLFASTYFHNVPFEERNRPVNRQRLAFEKPVENLYMYTYPLTQGQTETF